MIVGSRGSNLAKAQVAEIAKIIGPFNVIWVETVGDTDKQTSLRLLGKSDFFTKELDEMLINGLIDAAIHSAKDLPDPLHKALEITAITAGLDPRDALVFRKGWTLETLPENAVIATSSPRREDAARRIVNKKCRFIDLRGTIEERLNKKEADAVVIAEAALIRLNLTHLPRYVMPDETVEGQGKLAVVIRKGDLIIAKAFERCRGASFI